MSSESDNNSEFERNNCSELERSSPIPQGKEPMADFFCTTEKRSVKFSYLWTIKDFSNFISNEVESIFTEEFSSRETSSAVWQLALNNSKKRYLELKLFHIQKESEPSEISFKANITVLNANLEKFKVSKENIYVTLEGSSKDDDTWTKSDFILKKALEKKAYPLPKNSLLLFCEIWQTGYFNFQKEENRSTPEDRISDDYAKLFNNSLFCDTKIEVSGTTFEVHKVVLVARSPVFWAMFNPQNKTKEHEQSVVKIDDIEPKIFREVLRYLYTGKVAGIQNVACKLFFAADKYDLKGLKAMCKTTLYKILNTKNAMDILLVADQHNASHLKYKVLQFIKRNRKDVMRSKSFSAMLKSHVEFTSQIMRICL